MKKLLAAPAFLAVLGATGTGTASAAVSTAGVCTASNGGACTFGHWIVCSNTWGPTPGTYGKARTFTVHSLTLSQKF